jgi:hypothetical protein
MNHIVFIVLLRRFLFLLISLAAGPALAAEPFEGRWAEEAAWCARPDRASDETAIRLGMRELVFFASTCTVTRIVALPPVFRIAAQCRDEGENLAVRVAMQFVLNVTGDRLSLTEKSWGTQTYVRCP